MAREHSYYDKRGVEFYRKGKYEKAVANFNRAIELLPANAPYYIKRATAYEAQGMLNEAYSDWCYAVQYTQDNSKRLERIENRDRLARLLGKDTKDLTANTSTGSAHRHADHANDITEVPHVVPVNAEPAPIPEPEAPLPKSEARPEPVVVPPEPAREPLASAEPVSKTPAPPRPRVRSSKPKAAKHAAASSAPAPATPAAISMLPDMTGLVDLNAAISMNIQNAADKASALATLGKAFSYLGKYYEELAKLAKKMG